MLGGRGRVREVCVRARVYESNQSKPKATGMGLFSIFFVKEEKGVAFSLYFALGKMET